MKSQEMFIIWFHEIFYEFSAERRKSMGFDWHRQCLKCEECGKVLNPGQHAEVYNNSNNFINNQ